MFDGDGTIGLYIRGESKYSISCGITSTYNFCKNMQMKLNLLEINTGISIDTRSKTRISTIKVHKKDIIKFCELMYNESDELRLDRKYTKYLEIKEGLFNGTF